MRLPIVRGVVAFIHMTMFQKNIRGSNARLNRTFRMSLLLVASAVHHSEAQILKARSGSQGLTLNAVYDSVRSNSPVLAASLARVRSARGGISSARTWSNPMISFESQQMTDQPSGMSATQRETMTTAMIPLEQLYQRGPRIRRAEELKRAAEADALTQRQQVALDAADAFYRSALAQVNVDATRSLAQWFDTVVTYNAVRVREGVTAEADLIRSELERDHVLNELAIEESELARARADLQTFLGNSSDSAILRVEVDSLPLNLPINPNFRSAQLRGTARRVAAQSGLAENLGPVARPELQAAEARLLASEAAVASERRLLLREVGAMVGTKTSAGSSSLVAGFTVPFPLLDQNRGSIASARAETDAARFELAQQRRAAKADLLAAESAARILAQRVAMFGSGGTIGYLNRAAEGRRIALGAYREGGTSLLQVIDAARAWREARTSYFETLFAQHRSVISLLVSEGIDVIQTWPTLRAGATQ